MLFIFGSRNSYLKDVPYSEGDACPKCGNDHSFLIKTQSTYFHLFWVPVFPISKKHELHCRQCNQIYRVASLPADLKVKVDRTIAQGGIKRPLWHSCGCLVILAFMLISFLSMAISTLVALMRR